MCSKSGLPLKYYLEFQLLCDLHVVGANWTRFRK
jgi:hypothetical protein